MNKFATQRSFTLQLIHPINQQIMMKQAHSLFTILFLLFFSTAISIAQSSSKAILSNQQYQELLEETFDKDGPGATILVAKKGEIVYQGAVGKANMELDIPMTVDHVHRIGSITKQFTAVSILMLMEQGKLNLQDDLTKYIPDYPTKGKTITIEHLLTHTSGIKSMTGMPSFGEIMATDMTTTEMMDFFKNEPMDFEPGEKFLYNNSGYYLLGVIIENISGMTYADFIQKNIFDTLGMDNSYYGSQQQVIPNRASGYGKNGDTYVNSQPISMTLPYAAGSLLSTVEDLYKWNRALLTDKIVKQSTLQKAYMPYLLKDGEDTEYGYGWGISKQFDKKVIEHGGGIPGFLTQAIFVPEDDVFVAIFSNCNCQAPNGLTQRITAIELGEYSIKTPIKLTANELEEYVGVYQVSDGKSKRTIQVKDQHLTTQRSGGEVIDLYPFDKDQFYFKNSLTLFTFNRDHAGKITGMEAIRPSGKNDTATLTDEQPEEKVEIQVADTILEQYVGEYELMPGFTITVTVEENALMAQATNQPKFPLFATSDTNFFYKVVDAQVTFMEGENGQFSSMKLEQGGQELVGKRLEK